MSDRKRQTVPGHMRRAQWAKRVQFVFAIAAAGFAIYRLVLMFTQPNVLH